MKKFLAILASCTLAASTCAFAACGNGDNGNGAVEGNYTTPTSEELRSSVSAIDTDKVFSELGGIEIDSQMSFSYNMSDSPMSGSEKLNYKLNVDPETFQSTGKGTLNVSYKAGDINTNISATLYNDSTYIYADMSGVESFLGVDSLKAKINFMSLGDIMDKAPGTDDNEDWDFDYDFDVNSDDDSDVEVEVSEDFSFDANAFLDSLEEYKVNAGLDTSDGFKIKLSLTEETFWLLAADEGADESMVSLMKNSMTFNDFKCDIYFALDSEGYFSQFSLDINIDARDKSNTNNTLLKVSGYVTVKAYSGTVTLPTGIATDSAYTDMTQMLGMIGSTGIPGFTPSV